MIATNRRHHLSGHFQLTARFIVRPSVQGDRKDPMHRTIPHQVFCPGRTEAEADPYHLPNDLQELIRRIQRSSGYDEVAFAATLWSWWRQQPIPSFHPRIPVQELLRRFLRCRAEVLHVPTHQLHALHQATYNIFRRHEQPETQPGKTSIRTDLLRSMFDFHDQSCTTRQYAHIEQVNRQARGSGSCINFWNRLRAICPKGTTYNGPIQNYQGEICTTSRMLDQAMLDTQRFWFEESADRYHEWTPVLDE